LKTGEEEGALGREAEPELEGLAVLEAVIRLLLGSGLLDIATTDEQDMQTDPTGEVFDAVAEVELVAPVNLILSYEPVWSDHV
jgi:hypothetical protein